MTTSTYEEAKSNLEDLISRQVIPFGKDVDDDDLVELNEVIASSARILMRKDVSSFQEKDFYLLSLMIGVSTTEILNKAITALLNKFTSTEDKIDFVQLITQSLRSRILVSSDEICNVLLLAWPFYMQILSHFNYMLLQDINTEQGTELIKELKGLVQMKCDTRMTAITRKSIPKNDN